MMNADTLYSELKPELVAVADPLFDFSEMCLRKHGNFLPHAAVLTEHGEVQIVAASPDWGGGSTNATKILPLLHQGLRTRAKELSLKAIGIAENVTVTLEGRRATQAVKVLFEHRRGLNVAVYLPFEKKLLRGYAFGSMFTRATEPEVNAWTVNAN
jgi:hypothetical protein